MASRISRRRAAPPEDERQDALDEATEQEDANEATEIDADKALALADERALDDDVTPPVAMRRRPWYEYLPNWIPARVRNSIIELYNVTWPTGKETMDKTITVVVFAIVFAIIFFAVDQLFTSGLSAITDRIVHK
jgi:preprotein translocase SecE subunit